MWEGVCEYVYDFVSEIELVRDSERDFVSEAEPVNDSERVFESVGERV